MQDQKRPHKVKHGHTSQLHTIMCYNFFFAFEHFLSHLEHFYSEDFLCDMKRYLLIFLPRQEQDQQQQQHSFY